MTEARTYMDGYTDLLEQSFEINLNNYGPEDVERLNDWAINACAALETLQAEAKHLNLHLKATQSGRDAALARLAITEEANSMLLARNKWLEHTLEVAGASPVEPSQEWKPALQAEVERLTTLARGQHIELYNARLQLAAAQGQLVIPSDVRGMAEKIQKNVYRAPLSWAAKVIDFVADYAAPIPQPPAPSEAAREYMTGYSDGREWAGATNQAQPSQAAELDYEKKLDIVSNWFSDDGMQSRAMQMLGDIEQAIAAAPTFIIYEK